jgi:very-short-patch-repair endonuclease
MPHQRANPKIFSNAHELRLNLTEAEMKLWKILRANRLRDVHFRRQHAIGPYIVDFCAPSYKLIIELDGGQHLEQQGYDAERTAFLMSKGYRVLRFWNNEAMANPGGVVRVILDHLDGKVDADQNFAEGV